MTESDLLTADEAAKLLRISHLLFDDHLARGDIAYIAVGRGEKLVRKRFDPEDIFRFRDRQRRLECPPEVTPGRSRAQAAPAEGASTSSLCWRNGAPRNKRREGASGRQCDPSTSKRWLPDHQDCGRPDDPPWVGLGRGAHDRGAGSDDHRICLVDAIVRIGGRSVSGE